MAFDPKSRPRKPSIHHAEVCSLHQGEMARRLAVEFFTDREIADLLGIDPKVIHTAIAANRATRVQRHAAGLDPSFESWNPDFEAA